jgi:catechol 2,3-dioxygenase-like lactoylglutathione lyase family enzyme
MRTHLRSRDASPGEGAERSVRRRNEEATVSDAFRSSRDVIIRTDAWLEATKFYESVLGLPVVYRSGTIMGFETGSFCVYVEKGEEHGPVFEFLVPDVQAAKRALLSAGCSVQEENDSVPRCYIRDPFGMVFNIGQARVDQ